MSLHLLRRQPRADATIADDSGLPGRAGQHPVTTTPTTNTERPLPSRTTPPTPSLGFSHWRVWGTTVTLAVRPAGGLEVARAMLSAEIERFDAAASRFRADSDLSRLNAAAGSGPVVVGSTLIDAVRVALDAAAATNGAVDPTIGAALIELGYDRDFDELADAGRSTPASPSSPAPGWQCVLLDESASTVEIPASVALDLGATAKALCADRAADDIATALGCGVLVDLGGDLAIAGEPPAGGWRVGVTENARDTDSANDMVVAAWSGGVASSSTTVRTWERQGTTLHHIVDPSTGWPADPEWRLVTVAARTCVEANTAATAAVVWGEYALFEIAQRGLAARFVRRDGEVIEVGGWPSPESESDQESGAR